jgi:hypothetical protein
MESFGNPWAPPDVDTSSSFPIMPSVLNMDTVTLITEDVVQENEHLRIQVDTFKKLFDAARQETNCLKRKLDTVDRECNKRVMDVTNNAQRDINTAEHKASTVKRQLYLAQEETRECVRIMGKYIGNMRKNGYTI